MSLSDCWNDYNLLFKWAYPIVEMIITCYSTRRKFLLVLLMLNLNVCYTHRHTVFWKHTYNYIEALGRLLYNLEAFSASRINTEWRGGDDLAWSWGAALLQQSIAIGTESLTHTVWFKGHA